MVAGVGQCQNGINWHEYFSHNDGVLTWVKPTSNRVKAGSIAGWVDGKGYLRIRLLGRSYGVHRIVYEMHYGPIPDGMEIDHIDHNPLNNKIENLRVVCRAGNMKNTSKPIHNRTGVIGVSLCSRTGKFLASIQVDGKTKYLGRYMSIEGAAEARKEAERMYGFHENHGRLKK